MKESAVGTDTDKESEKLIYGRNPVLEAFDSGVGIEKLFIQKNIEGAGKKIYSIAKKKGIPIQNVDRAGLSRMTGTGSHQGVAATLSEYEYTDIEDILKRAEELAEDPFVVVMDGIEDPHNLGAIIRSADGAGLHGAIIPKNRAASISSTALKASAGAALHIPVAREVNIVRSLEFLKEKGLWVYGLDMDGEDYSSVDYSGAAALVIGAEGTGLSRLVREKCDRLISIPMRGRLSSLNASAAAAVAMYEIAKSRERK